MWLYLTMNTHVLNLSLVSNSLELHGLTVASPSGSSVHVDSPGYNTGMGCHALLQGFSQPRDRTQVSGIAGRFFTI